MRRKLTILLAILFVAFVGLGVHDLRSNQVELKLKEVKLQDATLELNHLRLEKEKLNQEFEEAINSGKINEEKVQQLEKEKLELEKRTRDLEQQLQAKKEAKERSIASVGLSGRASAMDTDRSNITGNKEDWLRASGIPESEWWAVDSIVSRESGWNPCAYNPGKSDCNAQPVTACGLAQALPCSKLGPNWTDPVHNLKWQYNYVKSRYGGYAQAVAFWNINHWY